MDFGQTSDPYCKLLLYPSTDMSHKWMFKSTVKKSTLQPEFNEEFVFQHIQLQELISKTLQITVYDKDMGKKDDYIGKYFIRCCACSRERDRQAEELRSAMLSRQMKKINQILCASFIERINRQKCRLFFRSIVWQRSKVVQ